MSLFNMYTYYIKLYAYKMVMFLQVRLFNEDVTFITEYPSGIYIPSINRTFWLSRYVYDSCPLDQCTNTIMVCAEDFHPEWWRQYTTSAARKYFFAMDTWILAFMFAVLHVLVARIIHE